METLLFVYGLVGEVFPLNRVEAFGLALIPAAFAALGFLRWASRHPVEPAVEVPVDEMLGGGPR